MNAGAYGFEMKDVVRSARVMTESGEILELSAEELQLGYRTSCIPARHLIALRLELAPGNGRRRSVPEWKQN